MYDQLIKTNELMTIDYISTMYLLDMCFSDSKQSNQV